MNLQRKVKAIAGLMLAFFIISPIGPAEAQSVVPGEVPDWLKNQVNEQYRLGNSEPPVQAQTPQATTVLPESDFKAKPPKKSLPKLVYPNRLQQTPGGAYEEQAANAGSSETWLVQKGLTLKDTLKTWASKSGWQDVIWETNETSDIVFGANAEFKGTMLDAIRMLIESLPPDLGLNVNAFNANKIITVKDQAK